MKDAQNTLTLSNSGNQDLVEALRKNLEQTGDNLIIRLPKSTYHLTDEGLAKQFLHISNNDSGLKAVAFRIRHRQGITIDGQGSSAVSSGKAHSFPDRK